MSAGVVYSVGRTCLVGGYHKGVNVALFRRIEVREVKLCWKQQFRSHVTYNARLGCCRATRLRDGGISDDTRDSEIPKAYVTLLGDQNIPLDRTGICACLGPRTPLSTHRVDVAVHDI